MATSFQITEMSYFNEKHVTKDTPCMHFLKPNINQSVHGALALWTLHCTARLLCPVVTCISFCTVPGINISPRSCFIKLRSQTACSKCVNSQNWPVG
jgi:hypothetical protein